MGWEAVNTVAVQIYLLGSLGGCGSYRGRCNRQIQEAQGLALTLHLTAISSPVAKSSL